VFSSRLLSSARKQLARYNLNLIYIYFSNIRLFQKAFLRTPSPALGLALVFLNLAGSTAKVCVTFASVGARWKTHRGVKPQLSDGENKVTCRGSPRCHHQHNVTFRCAQKWPLAVNQLVNEYVCFWLQVSWIRRRDAHILAVDRYTFIADERFQAFHVESTDTWTLQIKYVQARDAGQYECQISTEPKMSHFITLNVVGKCHH